MNLYVFNIKESYKDVIIGHLGKSGTADLLIQVVQCWHACAVYEEKRDLPVVLYSSGMMFKYYFCFEFFPIKHNEEEN